ncbi:MAG: translation initiation factor IF-2 [Planctomycetes bacterium]|nr:translation initiation factor IF-2 [Planctomycetota bacterium]MCB9911114.1 translation initiation factor IF-2 [Planctomycetota bacterium]MCB9912153.1 translation initiation factor IF-2 [Planctomycetota bacterium]HPF12833.1 translation initiation factor IF-2 [Planctomycetota bacterium]HRV80609.1 translation initiation factor IF-2 [Planctomycetota bacterium]
MPGKDLAAKLRDCGFTKARTHMSALDDFELVQAEGILQANGIVPVASASEEPKAEEAPLGGLLKRKRKTEVAAVETVAETPDEVEAPETHEEPAASAPTSEPVAETVEPAPKAVEPAAPRKPEVAEEPPVAPLQEVDPLAAPPAAKLEEPAKPEPEVAQPAAAVEPVAKPADEATPSQVEEAQAQPSEAAPAKPVPKAKITAKVNPKGTVVGFIDPATFQQQQAGKGRHQARRLVSSDDVAPDVRPTMGRGRTEKAGPRGNLTATQLREREQGRFLRRGGSRTSGGAKRGVRVGGRGSRLEVTDSPMAGSSVTIEPPITVSKLAEALKLKSSVVQKMAIEKKYGMFTLNTTLDEDTAVLLASEYEVELEVREDKSAEDQHLEEVRELRSAVDDSELIDRAPTVAVLGHVDHGKTTLIDFLRSTRVAQGEAGGITQHMGAYQITAADGRKLTIIDTPGHAAFTSMRARGAKAVDVVVLVVAGDDGVKPSTEEAINHAKAAGTPIVVAINKKDKPTFNANTVIQQLMGFHLVPEIYGGDTAMFEISALKGDGVAELVQHLVLMGEAQMGLKAHPKGSARGVVLEAEIQQGRGIIAHLLVQDGSLKKGDVLLAGEGYGKIKSIQNDLGATILEAGPSTPISVTGLDTLPGVGDTFFIVDNLAKAKEIATERERSNRAKALANAQTPRRDVELMLGKGGPGKTIINLIVRADVQGSVEVIRHEIEKLVHEEVEFKLVHSGVGPITESDVALATTSVATLIAFHVGVAGKVRKEAERNHLTIRRYNVIYELLDDLRDMMEGALAPDLEEQVTGHAEIKAVFRSSKVGVIAGCGVIDGSIFRNSKARLIRDGIEVYSGELASLRRESQDASEVREGFECGIVLRDFRDVKEGDIIETYAVKEIKRKLEI